MILSVCVCLWVLLCVYVQAPILLIVLRWINIKKSLSMSLLIIDTFGGARGVIVIVVGNEHGDTSSNPGRD